MSGAAASAKVCIICKQDCSRKPRSKDKQGRYTCDECAASAKAARVTAPAEPSAVAADDDGAIPFLEEESATSRPAMVGCPNCARPLASDAVICMGCGFNRATGRNVTTAMGEGAAPGEPSAGRGRGGRAGKAAGRKCKSCGYDLRGLSTAKCPECGTVNVKPTRQERDREDAARVRRNAWLHPIIMIVVGLTVISIMVGAAHGSAAVAGQLVAFGISVVLGLLVYLFCSVLWIGFDEPIPLTALRLTGVYALADIGYTAIGLLPIQVGIFMGFGFWTAATVIYVLLLSHIMELDLVDAIIVAIVTTVAKVIIVGFIVAKLSGLI